MNLVLKSEQRFNIWTINQNSFLKIYCECSHSIQTEVSLIIIIIFTLIFIWCSSSYNSFPSMTLELSSLQIFCQIWIFFPQFQFILTDYVMNTVNATINYSSTLAIDEGNRNCLNHTFTFEWNLMTSKNRNCWKYN